MAQVVGYFEDDVVYAEGPFVICNPMGNGWRIEAELKGVNHPVLPDTSIYELKRSLGLNGKTMDRSLAERVCDQLNKMVCAKQIVLSNRQWVARGKGKDL
jgi:hypothetical protein